MSDQTQNLCTEELVNDTGEESFPGTLEETEAAAEVEEVVAKMAPTELETALEELRPKLLEIPAAAVRRQRVNSTMAVAICLRNAAAFDQDRALLAKFFSSEMFDITEYDNLTKRALALWQADILLHRAEGAEAAGLVIFEEAKAMRFKMLDAAEYLYSGHPELGSVVADIRSGYSKLSIADDLASLVNLFREQWDDAKPNCRITERDLDAATDLCQKVIRASTITHSEEFEEMLDLRNRAAEYLRRGVDDVRSAASFVFRGDPEALKSYPSLFSGRKKKNGKGSVETDTSAEAPAASQPSAGEPASQTETIELAGMSI